jgi:hypothetical protein
MNTLQQRLEVCGPLAQALCSALGGELEKLGFATGSVPIGRPETAIYHLERDPAAGTNSLCGEWRDNHGHRIGMLLFHADGSFFAEHDVVRVHPRDGRWFVEAVHAWGREDRISVEPRLMPMVS